MTESNTPETPPIVTHDESPSLSEPAKKPPKKIPKWESEARDRLKAAIRRYNKPLSAMLERDENADYGICIDKELVAFIECKRIATSLPPNISVRHRLMP